MINQREESDKILRYAVYAIAFIVIILLGTYILLNDDLTNRGTFGDMFGFANSLFTGLSFVGLLVTIILQRQDLKSQRQDLENQNKAVQVQNFENTFFQMNGILHKVTEEVFAKQGAERLFGKIAMIVIHNDLRLNAQELYAIRNNLRLDTKITSFGFEEFEMREAISQCFDTKKNQLSHYFRTVFSVVELIEANSNIDKKIYINILTAQFSNTEIMLLMYYVYYLNDVKYKKYIEKYSLLRDLDSLDLLFPNVISYYNDNAYYTDSQL